MPTSSIPIRANPVVRVITSRARTSRSPVRLPPPPSQSTNQGRRREYKASNPASFVPSDSSAAPADGGPFSPTPSKSFDLPSRVQQFESTNRIAFALSMPSYQEPVTVPSGTDGPVKKMVHFKGVEVVAEKSSVFRRVLWTGEHSQLVIMTIPPGGEIGEEIHTVDQHLIFTTGTCKAIVAEEEKEVTAGDLVIVPAGTKHNFLNSGPNPLILYTVYAPAEHNEKTAHNTKEEGDKAEEEGQDEPPKWAKK